MRGILLASVALLAMTSVAFAQAPTLDYIITVDHATGYRTAVVQATGQNITSLDMFKVDGNVYQVWEDTGNKITAKTPWFWRDYGTPYTPDVMDSHVCLNGSYRVADLEGNPAVLSSELGPSGQPSVTSENNVNWPGLEGLGTLNNYDPIYGNYDSYVRVAGLDYTENTTEDVDLLNLVIPDGQTVTVDVQVSVAIYNAGTGKWDSSEMYVWSDTDPHAGGTIDHLTWAGQAMTIYSFTGDCDLDGDCDVNDLNSFGDGWYGLQAASWATGDFDLDGTVQGDVSDLNGFGDGWYGLVGPGTGAAGGEGSPVPEPGTMIMLVLGALCFAGYRLRK